jgi:glycolate oxidase
MATLNPSVIHEFRAILGDRGVLVEPEQLRTYECDALTYVRIAPDAVLLPTSTEQVQAVMRVCHENRIAVVARGSGTGLSGGALPTEGSVVVSLARMNRILEVDIANRFVVVEPGVVNAHVSERVAANGFFYAPDPSSLSVCTIGGNVAENSGGAHCLKYGFTVTHVLGIDVVLPDGELVRLGGPVPDMPGYDLAGVFVGSEGTLGIATRVTLRIVRRPEAVQTLLAAFESTDDAGAAVSAIIAAGLIPSAVEMMDRLSIHAVEAAVGAGYPDCGAILLVELDGPAEAVEIEMSRVSELCSGLGATGVRVASSDAERAALWKGRRGAFAAMGRIASSYIVQDGVIPRTALPRVLREIEALASRAGLRVANVFHAGDGNLHPMVLYDRATPGEEQKASALSAAILRCCITAGGSITGEHGVGFDKRDHMPEMFAEPDLETMQLVRCAFDPDGIANPGKIFPRPRLCGEKPGPYRPHPLQEAGIAELF